MAGPTAGAVHMNSAMPSSTAELEAYVIGLIKRILAAGFEPPDDDKDDVQKPYPSEHAARQMEPGTFKAIRRKNDAFGAGISVLYGVDDAGKTHVQSIRFDASKFTAEQAQKWLEEHKYKTGLETATGGSEGDATPSEVKKSDIVVRADVLIKSDEQHLLYAVVYAPNKVDKQGDFATEAEIEKMAHRWMTESRRYDLQHQITLPAESAVPVESYIVPADLVVGNKTIAKGSWVVVSHIPDDRIWGMVKDGSIGAYSIRGRGRRTPSSLQ